LKINKRFGGVEEKNMKGLLEKIAGLYKLNPLEHTEKVAKGYLSENHIIFDGEKKYFLKKYRFDNEEKIKQIHSVKQYFAERDIPVVLPFPIKDSLTFFSYNNSYYALFPFINEKQFERNKVTKQAAISMGEMLAKIHICGKNSTLKIDDSFKPWDKNNFLDKASQVIEKIKGIDSQNDFDRLALKSVLLKKKIIEKNEITYDQFNFSNDHLLHGDYIDQNVFFNENDQVAYVFDFEKAQYGPRTSELFRSMMNSFLDEGITNNGIVKAKLYFDAYCNLYPMLSEEIARGLKIFYFKAVYSLWVETEHYLNNNNRADVFLKYNFQKIRYFSKNLDKFINIFQSE